MKSLIHSTGKIKTLCRRLSASEKGVAYLEFALAIPMLLILFGGTVDVGRLILIHQKMEKAVFTVGDLVTQVEGDNPCPTISTLDGTVVRDIMYPLNTVNYRMAVSAVIGARRGGGPVQNLIEWRYNTAFPNSAIGSYSTPYQNVANMPAPLGTLAVNERVIVTEMRTDYSPLIPQLSFLSPRTIHKVAYHRSRLTSPGDARGTGNLSGCSL